MSSRLFEDNPIDKGLERAFFARSTKEVNHPDWNEGDKMKQAVMTQPGKIEFRDVEKPAIQPDEVLIQTRRIGVCGSDIHVFHGLHPYTSYPVVQGHEIGGVIAEVGAGVQGFAPGDKVVFMPQVTCGECYPCRHGMYHICDNLKVMGFQTGGAAQEFIPVKADMVLKLPESISLDEAAMVEPISVAVHAVSRTGGVAGKNVVVLGAGTIGNLVAQVAQASGAKGVMVTDISEYKLEKAWACGIQHVVHGGKEDLGQAILNAFGPDKADLSGRAWGCRTPSPKAVPPPRNGHTIVGCWFLSKKPPWTSAGLVQL
jgi:L-iditol 2-dehydrogenase